MATIYDKAQALSDKLITKFANPDTLSFEEKTSVSDGMGGTTTTWAEKFNCISAVIPLNGQEVLRSMQLNEESTHKAFIKVTDGTPSATDRLVFKGSTYNITTVLNLAEADATYKVMLKKGVVT